MSYENLAIVEALAQIKTAIDSLTDATGLTADDLLTLIKSVDGAGSGLDADTVDGEHAFDEGWASSWKAKTFSRGARVDSNLYHFITNNAKRTPDGWEYIASDHAVLYNQTNDGKHNFSVAPDGIAEDPISFKNVLALSEDGFASSGNLGGFMYWEGEHTIVAGDNTVDLGLNVSKWARVTGGFKQANGAFVGTFCGGAWVDAWFSIWADAPAQIKLDIDAGGDVSLILSGFETGQVVSIALLVVYA